MADAQVPGPGRRSPIPRNVPTIQAHGVRRLDDCGLVALVVIVIRLMVLVRLDFLKQLGIEDRRADAITAARPLAQIHQPASIAAEGKVFIRAQNDALAGRAAQTESLLTGHTYNMRATRS